MSFFSRPQGNNAEQLREQGRQLYKAGRLQEAFDLFQKALVVATTHRDRNAEAWVRHSIGLVLRDSGDPAQAAQQFVQALDLAKQTNDELLLPQDYGNLGTCYRLMGYLDDAIQCQQLSIDLAQRTDNPTSYSIALHNLAMAYAQQGKLDKAIPLCRERLRIAEQLQDARGVANTTLLLGRALLDIGAAQEANEVVASFSQNYSSTPFPEGVVQSVMNLQIECRNAIQRQRKGSSAGTSPSATNRLPAPPPVTSNQAIGPQISEDQAQAMVQQGLAELEQHGDITKALRYFRIALEYFRKSQQLQDEALLLGIIADAYGQAGALTQLLDYGQQSLAIMQRINRRDMEVTMCNSIGQHLARSGSLQQAVPYFIKSAEIAQEEQDAQNYAIVLGNLGQAYVELNQPAEALDVLAKALRVAQHLGDQEGEMNIQGSIGVSYRIMKRPKNAGEALFEQLRIAQALGNVKAIATANCNLANVYGDVGQYQEAITRSEHAAQLFAQIGDVMNKKLAYSLAQTYRSRL